MSIRTEEFGTTKDGQKVTRYILKNNQGHEVSFLDLGAVVQSALVPDKDGVLEDVVLGYDDVKGYETNGPSFGAPVGRCANRISGAKFTLNEKEYTLDKNDGENCLHSGFLRFNHCMYQAETEPGDMQDRIIFSRLSKDGEQGFPGNLHYSICYEWTDEDDLVISYSAVCDQDTLFNMTNHTYFNIGPKGHEGGSILDLEAKIPADRYTPIGATYLPTGEFVSVEDSPMDLREFTRIRDRIGADDWEAGTISGYDHNYILEHEGENIVFAGALRCPQNGRLLEMFTDCPGVQFYVAKELVEPGGKAGMTYQNYGGACLEAQNFPNGVNQENFPTPLLRAGVEYESTTVYRFRII